VNEEKSMEETLEVVMRSVDAFKKRN